MSDIPASKALMGLVSSSVKALFDHLLKGFNYESDNFALFPILRSRLQVSFTRFTMYSGHDQTIVHIVYVPSIDNCGSGWLSIISLCIDFHIYHRHIWIYIFIHCIRRSWRVDVGATAQKVRSLLAL